MNNMPYSALGGVMTGDVNERAKLEFVPFHRGQRRAIHRRRIHAAAGRQICRQTRGGRNVGIADKQYGWQMTMTIWAVLCLVLFLDYFLHHQGTHQARSQGKIVARNRILPTC